MLKNGTPITYADIAAQFEKQFGETKKPSGVKVTVNEIKHLEQSTGRKYLHESGNARGREKTYWIDDQLFVDRPRSAVILLETRRYEKTRPNREIVRNEFERYIVEIYGWDNGFVSDRVEDARKSDYLSFKELEEPGKQFIHIEDRLDDDIEYLKLIVEDYCVEMQRKEPAAPFLPSLLELLYGPGATPKIPEGEE